ncbi:ATP-binding protein [Sphingosinicella terrae]|uniref:ATP-binding protein n=1 Tax=Sphingosinicella terrae TaxID=2172047 RepID=UPI000E0DDF80|nr:ATP-binding protein [Sphingosinicella terrae]
MEGRSTSRRASALLLGGIGLAAALLAGAPLLAALLALLAGAAAVLLLRPAPPAVPAIVAAQRESDNDAAILRVEELLGSLDEPALLVRDRRVRGANEAARLLLGAHIEGTDVRLALRHPAAAERLTGEGPGEGRTELIGLGGAERQWLMRVKRLSDGSRLVRLTDLSQIRAAEQMRADFIANASHELRTPLATLLGFLETLQDDETASDAQTRRRFIEIMTGEASRMRAIIDDLISLSRIESERFDAPAEPVDLVPLIQSVKESVSVLSDRRGSPVEIEVEAPAPIVAGDRAQLAQLLRNLVTNALNYGRSGAPVRIRIEEGGGGMLRIRVIDQGEGIPADQIPRLTERFYRVDAGRSRAVGGTGLGLAIAKHIALRHRGRLEIVSKLGEGTSVRVHLPRA